MMRRLDERGGPPRRDACPKGVQTEAERKECLDQVSVMDSDYIQPGAGPSRRWVYRVGGAGCGKKEVERVVADPTRT